MRSPIFLSFLLTYLWLNTSFLFIAASSWTCNPFNPTSLPLAVKSPYLNVWLPQGSEPLDLPDSWVYGWPSVNGTFNGWQAFAIVDNKSYRLWGSGKTSNVAEQSAINYTPTRSTFTFQAGPMTINTTFFTPIEAADLTRLSFPFSYYFMTASSSDGSFHTVRFSTMISPETISTNHNIPANGSSILQQDVTVLQMQLQNPQPFGERQNVAEDSIGYLATRNGSGVSYQIGLNDDVVSFATNSSGLQNTIDESYNTHNLNDPFDYFALSADLGAVKDTSPPVVWAIGITRNPSINYTTGSGEQDLLSPYYVANFSGPQDFITFFLDDFDRALTAAQDFDSKITTAANSYSEAYTDLLYLTTRQALSALEVTVSKGSDGNWNTSDVKAFMKDMGDVGAGGVNAVDTLYSALPMFMYLNPHLIGYLLKPLLEAQEGQLYTQPYAALHLGLNYPNASIANTPHNFGIEASANMLIMSLAHAQSSGSSSLANDHYDLLKKWATYLEGVALTPGTQQSSASDGTLSTNQTNLALKGIVGVAAMGKISGILGQVDDEAAFNSSAMSLIEQWLALSISKDNSRLLFSYDDNSSGGLIYNLYIDRLLGLNLLPDTIYEMQTSYYHSLLTTNPYGLKIDSSTTLSRTDRMMFAAAAVTELTVRDSMVSLVHQFASSNLINAPLSVVYDPTTGISKGGVNSPAHGAMFALLALPSASNSTVSQSGPNSDPRRSQQSGKRHLTVIVGAVLGSAGAVAAVAFFFWRRRKARSQKTHRAVTPFESRESQSRELQIGKDVDIHGKVIRETLPYATQADPPSGTASPQNLNRLASRPSQESEEVQSEIRHLRRQVQNLIEAVTPGYIRHAGTAVDAPPPSYDDDV